MKKVIVILTTTVLIFACSKKGTNDTSTTESETSTIEERTESVPKNCTYSYNDSTTVFGWKAYKTSEKIGVGGTFDDIKVTSESANSIKEVLQSISFTIITESVNSNNDDRDGKIFSFFFNKMIGTDKISGKVKTIEGSDSVGTAVFEISMNEVTQEVSITYTTTDGIINFSGAINLEDFNG